MPRIGEWESQLLRRRGRKWNALRRLDRMRYAGHQDRMHQGERNWTHILDVLVFCSWCSRPGRYFCLALTAEGKLD